MLLSWRSFRHGEALAEVRGSVPTFPLPKLSSVQQLHSAELRLCARFGLDAKIKIQ